jgi:hypothetical protein
MRAPLMGSVWEPLRVSPKRSGKTQAMEAWLASREALFAHARPSAVVYANGDVRFGVQRGKSVQWVMMDELNQAANAILLTHGIRLEEETLRILRDAVNMSSVDRALATALAPLPKEYFDNRVTELQRALDEYEAHLWPDSSSLPWSDPASDPLGDIQRYAQWRPDPVGTHTDYGQFWWRDHYEPFHEDLPQIQGNRTEWTDE